MKTKILIKNGFVISENTTLNEKYDIYIENGIIKKIGKDINVDAEIINADGMFVIPGLIDMYCKICESGYENKNNIITISDSAAFGGYTTITSAPNSQPVIDNKTVVEYVYTKTRDQSDVNILPYGSMTKNCEGREVAELGQMIASGAVAISDGGTAVANTKLLKNVFLYSKMFDVPVITFCQDSGLAGNGVINSGYMSTKMGLAGIPREAEEIAVAQIAVLAKYTGARVHLSHITTKGAVEHIRYAKSNGIKITAGTCPHYFALSEKAVEGYNTFAKVSPPLRTEEDIEAIKNGIKDGTIDVISSGHTPASIDRKITEFDKAAFGISGLEVAFPISYTELVGKNVINIYKLCEKMSKKPAEILGLQGKGEIKEGFDSDIAVVDVKNEYFVKPEFFYSRAKYSPYDNRRVNGRTICTIAKGKILWQNQKK